MKANGNGASKEAASGHPMEKGLQAELDKSSVAFRFGDCLKLFPKIPDGSIDMVFADPPYNMSKKKGLGWAFSKHVTMQEAWDRFSKDEFFKFNLDWMGEALRVLKPTGSMFVCGSYHNIFQLGFILQTEYDAKILNDIIWFKPNAQPNITARMFTQSTETLIWVAKNSGWKFKYWDIKELNGGKQMRNMWEISVTPASEKSAGDKHPTQKPLKLLDRCIRATTDEGDVVLDPFLGTGTTLVAAKMLGRKAIGFELNEDLYGDLIRKRLSQIQTKLA